MPRSDPKASNDVLRVAVTENPSDKDHGLLSGPLGLVLDCQLSDFSDSSIHKLSYSSPDFNIICSLCCGILSIRYASRLFIMA